MSITTLSTHTVTPAQTFQDMCQLFQTILGFPSIVQESKVTKKQTVLGEFRDVLSHSELLLVPSLSENEDGYNLLPLKLLCEGFALSQREPQQRARRLTFHYQTQNKNLINLSVTLSQDQDDVITVAVQAAKGLQALKNLIDILLASLRKSLNTINTNELGTKIFKEQLTTIVNQTFPNYLNEKQFEYQAILAGITLSNYEEPMTQLSELLKGLREETLHQVSVIQSACQIYNVVKDKPWFGCVVSLLSKRSEYYNVYDVLYKYMVGYYVTNDMCTQVYKGWMINYTFRRILERLQGTTNPEHKAFFIEWLSRVTELCTEQYNINSQQSVVQSGMSYARSIVPALPWSPVSPPSTEVKPEADLSLCMKRMKKSADILGELAKLVHVLETWTLPENRPYEIRTVYSSANELLTYIAALEVNYLLKFVPQNTNATLAALERLKNNILDHPEQYVSLQQILTFTLPSIAVMLGYSALPVVGVFIAYYDQYNKMMVVQKMGGVFGQLVGKLNPELGWLVGSTATTVGNMMVYGSSLSEAIQSPIVKMQALGAVQQLAQQKLAQQKLAQKKQNK